MFISHAQLNCVHFGNISDINSPKDMVKITYPYVFIITNNITVTRQMIKASFDVVLMNQYIDNEIDILKTQSDMLEIGRDIMASYILTDATADITLEDNIISTPFVERFKDNVAGVTMQMNFTIGTPISKCFFPTR